MRYFVTFRLDEQLFGVEVLSVREVNRQIELSDVPQAPDYVRGMINLRGQIVTILDLGVRLGLAPREIGSETHNVVLKTADEIAAVRARENRDDLVASVEQVGLLVDGVGDVVEVSDQDIEPPPASVGEVSGAYLDGVVKLPDDLLVLLNLERVLRVEAQAA